MLWVTLRSASKLSMRKQRQSPMADPKTKDDFNENSNIYVHCLGLVWEWCPAILWNAAQLAWSSLPLKSDTCTPSETGSSIPSESHTKYQLSTCKSTDTFFNCFSEWRQASIKETIQKKNFKLTLSVLTSTYSNWWGEMMGFKV